MRKLDKIMEIYGLHSADLAAEPLKMNDPEVLKQKVYAYFGDLSKVHFIDDLGDQRLKRLKHQIENGVKFKSVFADFGKDNLIYTNEPKEGYQPALIPDEE
jgi:hypothetical protein